MIHDDTQAVNQIMAEAQAAAPIFGSLPLAQRAAFMRAVATALEALGDELIQVAGEETHLPEARLRGERARTMYQLTSYADACERGHWLQATIDTALPDKVPPRPDLRKLRVPLGPVVVFGAANFPFAYSTAGGDTASAWAAGCPVVVKAHPAHLRTSTLVAQAISQTVAACGLPRGVFAHAYRPGNEIGQELVTHPYTAAVGFTGSQAGGRQLFDWANQRPVPIPVFAEMSSINPVFLLPGKLRTAAAETAAQYAASITLGVGQFCTNPGLLIGIESEALQVFADTLANAMRQTVPAAMLHQGIADNYTAKRQEALAQPGVGALTSAEQTAQPWQGLPTLATVTAERFLQNPLLHGEVFGPYSLLVRCNDMDELLQVAQQLEGQLTATLMATAEDLQQCQPLIQAAEAMAGRIILNGVPTGVEVCQAMQHGGPYPSTTDSRFGSVGADAIQRFCRPRCYQSWPNEQLPAALKDDNPLRIWRTVNNELTDSAIKGII
jgi:2,5-dioxopentanoate dehydrogenase